MFDFPGSDELAMTREEGEFLYGLVRLIKPINSLEIGTHKGFSTRHIIQAIKDNGFGHLWTTDIEDFGVKGKVRLDDRQIVDFLLERGENVNPGVPLDFVFVDGMHSLADVRPEIANIIPQLAPNAIVLFHDAQNEETNLNDGVNAAIKEAGLTTTWLPSAHCYQIYQHKQL